MSTQSSLVTSSRSRHGCCGDRRVAEVYSLIGDYDAANTPRLWRSIQALVHRVDGNIVLDLSGVTFMDASGIRVVVMAQQMLEIQSRRLALRNPSTCAARLLDICGLYSLVE
jgi:anti-sigma B factor antagonist